MHQWIFFNLSSLNYAIDIYDEINRFFAVTTIVISNGELRKK